MFMQACTVHTHWACTGSWWSVLLFTSVEWQVSFNNLGCLASFFVVHRTETKWRPNALSSTVAVYIVLCSLTWCVTCGFRERAKRCAPVCTILNYTIPPLPPLTPHPPPSSSYSSYGASMHVSLFLTSTYWRCKTVVAEPVAVWLQS
jgi:hypothetical protein